jgi:V8-like Glu-specific endopeptidase
VSTKERLSTDHTGEVETPFLDQELFVGGSEGEWEPRAAALTAESPFQSTFEQGRGPFDSPEMEEPRSFDEEPFSEDEIEEEEESTEWSHASVDLQELETDMFGEWLTEVERGEGDENEADEEAPGEFEEAESWREPEAPEFEYDLGSTPRDFSLKGLADRNNLPDVIRADILRDGKTDVNDLAHRALWSRHPDIAGQQLDRTGSKHAKLRSEWGAYAQQAKALIWLRQVIEELDKTRGNIPRDFLLGWMAVESDGRVSVVTKRPERGYFQIDWKAGEAREQLGLSEAQFKRLSTNRVFSIEKGIELAEKYRQWILTNYPSVPDQSELLWRLTKCRHAASGALKDVLDGLVRRKSDITWATVSPRIPAFMRQNVDATLNYAGKLKPFAELVGAPAPAPAPGGTQPELYGESAPWLREIDEEEFTEEAFEEELRDPPKKAKVPSTFNIPFRWVCKIAIRKDGKYHHGGSGVLISDRHVLTAAHVVYDVYKDRARYDLEVTPALDGHDDLGTYSSSGKPQIPALYESGKPDYDYALITLDTAIGQRTFRKLNNAKLCFWGSPDCGAGTVLVRVDPKSLLTQTAYTAGYPKNKGGSTMWYFSGLLVSVQEKARTMSYTGEGTEGQSGSPVWMQKDGQYMLIGVLVARGQVKIVVRVTHEFVRQIADWMSPQQKEAPEEEFEEDLERREQEQEEWESEAEDEPLQEGFAQETLPGGGRSEYLEEYQNGGSTGLVLLDHMHVPKTPDPAHAGTFKIGSLTGLKTADLNPGFIDASDNLITDVNNAGLQRCLELSITSDFQGLLTARNQTKPGPGDRVRVALVDLTGNKLTKPDFAGWGSTAAIYGASVPKILAVYAAFQLRSDLRELAGRKSPKDGADLERQAIAEWNTKGLTKLLPNLVWLFDIRHWTPGGALDFTGNARSSIGDILHDCPAADLIVNTGFPYIGSVTWQSGLYHAKRSGLWLRASYCGKATWASPVATPNSTNATALSAATYFTLLAQGRLVDDASSGEIRTALRHACVTSLFPPLPVVASKCGIWREFIHDCAWIEDTEVRYAVAVMSRLATNSQARLYTKLCKELDTLVRENNKSPSSRKICI